MEGASRGRFTRAIGRAAGYALPGLLVGVAALSAPVQLRVVGGASMAPALLPGDVCFVREGSDGIVKGDIALFRKDGWPGGVLHRVVAIEADGSLRMRGDANPVSDLDPVARDAVVGECVSVLPLGRAAHFLGSLSGGTLPGQLNIQRR